MNEIEKLYKNVGIKMQHLLDVDTNQFADVYPPFTAEKQLKLIKWFINSKYYRHAVEYVPWILNDIAMYINSYWDAFTDTERIEIKEILE